MQLARYKKNITVESKNNDRFNLITDGGMSYRTRQTPSTNKITSWWNCQSQTPWRETQKEYIVKEMERRAKMLHWNLSMDLYEVWNPGYSEYQQNHDVVFMHEPNLNLYVLSTYEHTWIIANDLGTVDFDADYSLGNLQTAVACRKWMTTLDNVFRVLKQQHFNLIDT